MNQTLSYKVNEEIPLSGDILMKIRGITIEDKFIREGIYFNYTCSPKSDHAFIKVEFWRITHSFCIKILLYLNYIHSY